MILNQAIREQLRQLTLGLMSGGPAAATAAIQNVLKGMPSANGAAIPPMPDFMHDMKPGNPDFVGNGPEAGAMPEFVADLLARLGLPLSQQGWGVDPNVDQPQAGMPPADEKAPGQFLTRSFTNQAGTRGYKLYIPGSYHGQTMSLVVMLHGCTQNPDDFAAGTCMNAVAEERQCFVVYPAQAQSANASKCWNWFKSVDQQREQGEPSIIAGITREVLGNYNIDAAKVYVAGLSSGGAMAVIMATTYPDLYAAVGVHSGLPYASARDLPSAFAAMRGSVSGSHAQDKRRSDERSPAIPIIIFHGDRDTTVNASNGDQLMNQNTSEFRLNKNDKPERSRPDVIVEEGAVPNGHRYTRTSHHHDGRTLAEHWLIHGAGHAWAGGSINGTYTDAKGPDATREMIRFFHAQP